MKFDRIYIEISNICNLHCHFCPEVERAGQILSLNDFEHILCEVKPYTDQVCLHVMGEPLAHPEFKNFIAACERFNLRAQITTNATLLKPQNVSALLTPTVRQVNISLQSFAANLKGDDYEDKLERYLAAIFELVDLARAERPDLFLQFRMWNRGAAESAREEKVNVEMIKRLEEKFALQIDFAKIDLRFRKAYPLGGRCSVQFDSRFRWPSLADDVIGTQGFCHALSSHIAIHADGKVVPCCLDKEAKIELGNVFKTSFAEILASRRLQNMKSGFAKAQLCESLCQRCDYIQRFSAKALRISESQVVL